MQKPPSARSDASSLGHFIVVHYRERNVRWLDLLGFAAAAAALAGFCMNTIINLRMMALASNLLFVVYGLLAQIYPVALLHMILLPINLLKLRHIRSQACSAEPQRPTTPPRDRQACPE